MATMPRGNPRSVSDPGAAVDKESTRREAELRRRREDEEARMRKLKETADIASYELIGTEGIPKAVGHIGRDAAASSAAKSIGRYAGPAGVAVGAAGAAAGYRADRLAGVPRDEAMLKNGGGFAGNLAGAASGAVLGAEFGGPTGAVLGTVFGGLGGSKAIEGLQPVYRELKAHLFVPRSNYGPRFQPSNMVPMLKAPSSDPRFWMSVLR